MNLKTMANNINIQSLVGEVNELNKQMKQTALILDELIKKSGGLNKELSQAKGLKQTQDALNKSKATQNQIEKEGEKLLAQRNAAIAKQSKLLKPLTLETIKQQEALKEQNKQLREQARADLGLKKRAGLFQSMTKSILASGAAFLSLTGLINLAKKAFDGITKGSQAAGDAWNRTMGGMTAATKSFFAMVGTADFTDFTGKLKEAIKAGREYADALDDLFEGGLSLKIAEANAKKNIAIQEEIRDNVRLTLKERIAAANEINRIEDDILSKRITEFGKEYEAHAKYIEGINGLDRDKLINFITNYRVEEGIRESALKKLEQEKVAQESIIAASKSGLKSAVDNAQAKYDAAKKSYTEEEKIYLAFYEKYQRTTDEVVGNVIESYAKITEAEGRSIEERRRNNTKLNSFLKELNKELTVNNIENLQKIENEHKKRNDAITDFVKQQIKERLGDEQMATVELSAELLKRYEANKEYLEKVEADEKASEDRKKFYRQEALNATSELGNVLFDLAQSQRDRELEGIRSNYSAKIAAAEGNSELQEKLAKELARKEAEIQREQAKSEQNQALFNVVISTAAGIMRTIENVGMPAAIPFIAFQSGLGLLQAALIKSQPLPEIPGFFKGTEDAPAGLKWVAEKGSELIKMPDGSNYLAKDKMLINTKGGEKILKHEDTMRELNSAIYNDIAMGGNGVSDKLDVIAGKMDNLKQINVNFDADGMGIYVRKGNNYTKYLNRKGRK